LCRLSGGYIPDEIDKELVNAPIVREFGMKRGSEEMALTDEDRRTVTEGEDFDIGTSFDDLRGAYEDHLQRAAR
jgi:hypothetical protein